MRAVSCRRCGCVPVPSGGAGRAVLTCPGCGAAARGRDAREAKAVWTLSHALFEEGASPASVAGSMLADCAAASASAFDPVPPGARLGALRMMARRGELLCIGARRSTCPRTEAFAAVSAAPGGIAVIEAAWCAPAARRMGLMSAIARRACDWAGGGVAVPLQCAMADPAGWSALGSALAAGGMAP